MRPQITPGPWLLRSSDPSWETHRGLYGELPDLKLDALLDRLDTGPLHGRGGAGFPFTIKLRTAAARRVLRRHVVVNLSEGEPASAKDLALAITAPHLILDGAQLAARALGVRDVRIVVPSEQPWSLRALTRAMAERDRSEGGRAPHWHLVTAEPRFVAGESSAVIELLTGRANLPVTTWTPSAVAGFKGQPTLLSNGETYAQVAARVLDPITEPGTHDEPGTRLLSISTGRGPISVLEAPHGTPWSDILTPEVLSCPILVGGFHGTWAAAGALRNRTVSTSSLAPLGVALGAGIVIPLPPTTCPLEQTAAITRYLARQSANRCGPCLNGLPALADALESLLAGGPTNDVAVMVGLVDGRGACAHPDGTARLVRSALTTFPDEVIAHQARTCGARNRSVAVPA